MNGDAEEVTTMHYIILFFVMGVIGYLLWAHTGKDKDIAAAYWVGSVATLLPQIAMKMFKLKKRNNK